MVLLNRIKSWVFETEDNEDDIVDQKAFQNEQIKNETIAIIKLKDMDNIFNYCNLLKQGNVIIFNLEEMKKERQRFLDFISGALMATNGIIKKLNNDIIVCIPNNIKLTEENET